MALPHLGDGLCSWKKHGWSLQAEPRPVIVGSGLEPFTSLSCLPVHSLSLSQPRDVTNLTVGGFTPMSPRISSPMHPSAEGEMGSEFRGQNGGALSGQLESLVTQSGVKEMPQG